MHRFKNPGAMRPSGQHGRKVGPFKTALACVLVAGASIACAEPSVQPAAPAGLAPSALRSVFDAAWARQPDAVALQARRDGARAAAQAARAWTPEPPALEATSRSDGWTGHRGVREHQVGVAIPLWLTAERDRSQQLAEAEGRAVESRASAAQLRVAAAVRDAWWGWQRAWADLASAQDQLASARRLADDVARRVQAGDLARADQHLADAAVAAAEAESARAQALQEAARQSLIALAGGAEAFSGVNAAEQLPGPHSEPEPRGEQADQAEAAPHAELAALADRAAVAEAAAALSASRTRANPELIVAATRERGGFGERYEQSLTVGVRIPFGGGPRHDARVAAARADALELQAQLALERSRLQAERESARSRTDAARTQLAAAEKRARLASESRGFFDKSFRLGQTDLPTRLRVEAEGAEAERQALRARIELAAAVSAWRQALGLLPA